MQKNISVIHFWPFLLLTLGLLSCSLLNAPGTIDMHTWARWTQDYLDYGPLAGYAHNKTDYPPLMIFIFYVFAKGFSLCSVGSFMAIKTAILFFALLATFLVYCWTKNYALTALFHLSFIINSVCLGYADVILGSFLIFALMQLHKGNLLVFALAYSLAIFIKWQALIIAPFLALYVFFLDGSRRGLLQNLRATSLPFLVISGVVISAYGVTPVYDAFAWAFHHLWLSGYALNMHWLITFLYQAFSPELFGGLNHGEISFIATQQLPLPFLLAKLVFAAGFCSVLFVFARVKSGFENLLVFALAGYLLYFTFNTGVHENHLFLALILGVMLSAVNASYLSLTLYIALAFNINMLFFYGIDGQFHFPRVIQGILDPTLLFALLNTVLFSHASYLLVRSGIPSPTR
jgi:hypothetical protein